MGTRGKRKGEISMKHHATQLFPIALQELLEIGEKALKQREQRERAKHVARPRETRACMQSFTEREKIQLTFNLK